jgi:D-xylose transport system ATP-binding protein
MELENSFPTSVPNLSLNTNPPYIVSPRREPIVIEHPLLEAIGVSKSFGATRALADVTFELRPGEVHALCGENGAGKSTLIKVLSGYYPHGSFSGELRVGGAEAKFFSVRESERAGVAVVHQELALVENLSAAENVLLGRLPRRGWRIDWPYAILQARDSLAALHAGIDPERPVRELGIGQRQLVEIARALARSSRVLILDEPTAALAEYEVELVLAAVRRLRERGVACIYISHKLSEVLSIADRVTVLRDGRTVGAMARIEASLDRIVRLMVGREIGEVFPARRGSIQTDAAPAVEVTNLSAIGPGPRDVRLQDISLSVAAGEIVGLGGLLGSGRSELLMHLYGLWGRRCGGEVRVNGERYDDPTPKRSLARKLALISEDRQRLGLVAGQTIGANLSLSSLKNIVTRGRLDPGKEAPRNAAMLSRLHLRKVGAVAERPVRELSGGNQQKVVIGRGLLADPRVILLDEPTRGVDIGARREIYELIRAMAGEGLAVLMISSELAELTGLCDRIAILREGRLAGVFGPDEFEHARLMAAATT